MAELALRRGEHLQALTLAEHALSLAGARKSRGLRFRALLVAGQAANVGTDEVDALNYFKRAEEVAQTSSQAREALWGQLMCLSELEESSAVEVLEELAASNPRDDPRQVVREAGRRLGVEFRFGAFRSIRRAAHSHHLLPLVSDPVVRASFRSTYSTALALCARYDLAAEVARELLADAGAHRLAFVRPYGLATLGIALAGGRDFSDADASLSEALALSRDAGNSHAEFNAFAIQLRSLLQQGRAEEALAIPEPIGEVPGKGMLGEVIATRALVRACSGRFDDALTILAGARGVTSAIEARVLIPAVEAIVALGKKDRKGPALAERTLWEAEDSGALDLVVAAYRGSPQLFAVLMSSGRCRERVWPILALACDEWLAESIGRALPQAGDRKALLSRREREVYELMCEGLTNGQIAACLVISEETVKLHVHHVFDKLGIRSRTALMLEAAQARAQAAPRTESIKDDSDSSTAERSSGSTED
jgi:DNA-binding CsgD family transcriptional regulator/tetratricopeptide (TPR) repeat protein